MSNGDPRDGFAYPTLTLMIAYYSLSKPRGANGDPLDGFAYPTITLMIDYYSLGKPRDAKR